MRRSSLSIGIALVLAATTAACTAGNRGTGIASISPAAGSVDGTLGQDLARETCRGVPRSGAAALPGEPVPLDILCGTGLEPVGSLWMAVGRSGKMQAPAPRQSMQFSFSPWRIPATPW